MRIMDLIMLDEFASKKEYKKGRKNQRQVAQQKITTKENDPQWKTSGDWNGSWNWNDSTEKIAWEKFKEPSERR